jgi:hypothetical protein
MLFSGCTRERQGCAGTGESCEGFPERRKCGRYIRTKQSNPGQDFSGEQAYDPL